MGCDGGEVHNPRIVSGTVRHPGNSAILGYSAMCCSGAEVLYSRIVLDCQSYSDVLGLRYYISG